MTLNLPNSPELLGAKMSFLPSQAQLNSILQSQNGRKRSIYNLVHFFKKVCKNKWWNIVAWNSKVLDVRLITLRLCGIK